ncbi:MAG: hypothetical protein Q9210_001789 [Variospora velana]
MQQQSLAGAAPNNPNQDEPTLSLVPMMADWRQKNKDEEDAEDDDDESVQRSRASRSCGLKGRKHSLTLTKGNPYGSGEAPKKRSPKPDTKPSATKRQEAQPSDQKLEISYPGIYIYQLSRKANSNLTGIPDSWLSAMKNQVSLAELTTDRNESTLKLLTDNPHGVPRKTWGFRLIFEFAENDYFANEVITKTYYYQDLVVVEELLFEEGGRRRPNSGELRQTFTGGWKWCSLSRKHKLRSAPPSSGLLFRGVLEPLTAARTSSTLRKKGQSNSSHGHSSKSFACLFVVVVDNAKLKTGGMPTISLPRSIPKRDRESFTDAPVFLRRTDCRAPLTGTQANLSQPFQLKIRRGTPIVKQSEGSVVIGYLSMGESIKCSCSVWDKKRYVAPQELPMRLKYVGLTMEVIGIIRPQVARPTQTLLIATPPDDQNQFDKGDEYQKLARYISKYRESRRRSVASISPDDNAVKKPDVLSSPPPKARQ